MAASRPIAEAVRLAAGGVLSGPAGGVAGSRYAARLLGHGNLIPFDMGGTRTDISLVVDGEAALRRTGASPASAWRCRASTSSARRRRRLDRARRPRRHPARRPRERRRGAGPRLLRPRRHRGDGDRRQSGARASSIPTTFSAGARGSIAGRRGGGRPHRARARRRPHGGGRGHLPRGQHPHGRGHPPGLGAARRRSAALRPAVVRRRGRRCT